MLSEWFHYQGKAGCFNGIFKTFLEILASANWAGFRSDSSSHMNLFPRELVHTNVVKATVFNQVNMVVVCLIKMK